MDNTNIDYLVIGNIDGTIARYDSIINNFGPFTRIDSNYSEIQTLHRSVPAIADLDGDGKYDMVVGNKLGGLHYFKQVKNVIQGETDITLSNNSIELYPNPATESIHLLYKMNTGPQSVCVRISDLSGKELLRQQLTTKLNNSISISGLSAGMYMAEITLGEGKVIKKFIKQ